VDVKFLVMLIHSLLESVKSVLSVDVLTSIATLATEVQGGNFGQSGAYDNVHTPAIEYALLGYKGPEFYDTGIIYCPYIPVMVQRTIGPNDFAPRVGLLTRYGVVDNIFGSNLYYHVVIVQGLGTEFTPGTSSVYF
jgi:hypothetical protein